MAVTYSWKNIKLQAHKNMYGQTDVVFLITADLEAVEGTHIETKTITTGVSYDSEGTFTDMASITKDQAVSWIESALGDSLQKEKDQLASYFQFTVRSIED